MSRLANLHQFGQSPWYDNIERGLLLSGVLEKMIEEDGIAGVTSNPTIFEKAINGSSDYDEAIKKLAQDAESVEEIYDDLTASDISQACGLLADTYQTSKGLDGYVSIEVSPHLAHDTKTTVLEAKRIFYKLGKENLMIKIPATAEGIPAIAQLIAEGINVNATLIFSQAHYRAVVNAYLEGLEERVKKGKETSKIASVASLFVSRIDSYVDKIIGEKKAPEELLGKAAVAQSKIIYQIYRREFSSPRFKKLGAPPQRLLFASTSTKNPAYSDVKYVEELIGEGTVNTLPQATLDSFRDHGTPAATLAEGIDEAKAVLERLNELGIDLELVCQKIQDDGVRAFVESYDKLLRSLEEKRKSFIRP